MRYHQFLDKKLGAILFRKATQPTFTIRRKLQTDLDKICRYRELYIVYLPSANVTKLGSVSAARINVSNPIIPN